MPTSQSSNPMVAAGVAWLGGRYFGRAVSVAAGFFFAPQPWSSVYGRSLALVAVVPPFAMTYVALLAFLPVKRHPWEIPAAARSAGLLPAVHLGGIWLWPLLPLAAFSRPTLLSFKLVSLTAPGRALTRLECPARLAGFSLLRSYAAGASPATADAWRLL